MDIQLNGHKQCYDLGQPRTEGREINKRWTCFIGKEASGLCIYRFNGMSLEYPRECVKIVLQISSFWSRVLGRFESMARKNMKIGRTMTRGDPLLMGVED